MKKIDIGSKIHDIQLDDLVIDKTQVRTKNVGKEIHQLAENIKKIGLLEPIIVCSSETEDGKYEIIAGQRRFLAHRELKLKTIKAAVIDRPLDPIESLIISVSENWLREDLSRDDELRVCLTLWRRYTSIDFIVDETGLPPKKVRHYLKYESLIKPLQKMVDDAEIKIDHAERAQAAASVTGETNTEEAIAFAKEMATMSGVQQDHIVKERREEPSRPAEEVIEEARTGQTIRQIQVQLGPRQHAALQKFATAEDRTQGLAAASLITDGLMEKGYLEDE